MNATNGPKRNGQKAKETGNRFISIMRSNASITVQSQGLKKVNLGCNE